jgi:hypothetical protein
MVAGENNANRFLNNFAAWMFKMFSLMNELGYSGSKLCRTSLCDI